MAWPISTAGSTAVHLSLTSTCRCAHTACHLGTGSFACWISALESRRSIVIYQHCVAVSLVFLTALAAGRAASVHGWAASSRAIRSGPRSGHECVQGDNCTGEAAALVQLCSPHRLAKVNMARGRISNLVLPIHCLHCSDQQDKHIEKPFPKIVAYQSSCVCHCVMKKHIKHSRFVR